LGNWEGKANFEYAEGGNQNETRSGKREKRGRLSRAKKRGRRNIKT